MRRSLALLCLLLAAAAAADEPSEVSATLDRDRIALNETVQLALVFRGSIHPPDNLSLPLTNLKIVGGPNVETRFEWINGATSHSITMTYVLAPIKIGPARVGAMKLKIGGRLFQTSDLDLDVGPAAAAAVPVPGTPESAGAGPQAILIQTVSPPQPYAGEQALWTLTLLTRQTVQGIEMVGMPDFHGLWAEDLPQPSSPRPTPTNYEGRIYEAYVIARRAIFPNHSGTLEIGSVRATVALRIPAADIFGDFSFGETRALDRTAPAVHVVVRGPNFAGPVGKFSLSASVDRTHGRVGQPFTVRLTQSGDGLLRSAAPPSLRAPGARIYPPTSRSSVRREATRVTNVREWSWIVVPERAGPMIIAPFELAYFDPSRERVATASTRLLPLTIDPAPPAAPARTPSTPHAAPSRALPGLAVPPRFDLVAVAAAAFGLLTLGFLLGWRRGRARPFRRLALTGTTRDERTAALLERVRTLSTRCRPQEWTAERAREARDIEEEVQALRKAPELGRYGPALAMLEARLERLERRAGAA